MWTSSKEKVHIQFSVFSSSVLPLCFLTPAKHILYYAKKLIKIRGAVKLSENFHSLCLFTFLDFALVCYYIIIIVVVFVDTRFCLSFLLSATFQYFFSHLIRKICFHFGFSFHCYLCPVQCVVNEKFHFSFIVTFCVLTSIIDRSVHRDAMTTEEELRNSTNTLYLYCRNVTTVVETLSVFKFGFFNLYFTLLTFIMNACRNSIIQCVQKSKIEIKNVERKKIVNEYKMRKHFFSLLC